MNDPRLKRSRHIVFNLSRPDQSLILLAPLARAAGGYGLCQPRTAPAQAEGAVFASKHDPGFILAGHVRRSANATSTISSASICPLPAAIRPRDAALRRAPPRRSTLTKRSVDVYAIDRQYWESLWYRPAPPPGNVIVKSPGG